MLLCIDDINIAKLINQLDRKIYITYGFSDKADYQIVNWKVNENGSEFFLLCHPDTERAERVEVEGSVFKISLFGKHNIVNATAVIVQLLQLGFKVNEIKKAIIGFTGAERRSELVYRKNNTYLFDDYGHHPNEIKATIEAARARFKNKKVIVIFQPHTFSRTNFLLKEFRKCLSLADFSFILPIFASARENKSQFKIDSKDIVKGKSNLFYVQSDAQLVNRLNKVITKGDVIFTMGAGDVYKLKNKIIALINSKFEIRNSKQIINHKLQIQKNKDLSHFLTLRNRVKAEYFLEAKTKEDLVNAKRYSLENKLPLFILGGGSNLAIVKNTIAGLVVKNSYRELKILAEGRNDVIVSVSSGYPVSLLVAKSIKNGWGGFEYHQGLPGTVGGAIYMNSKWTKPVIYFGDGLFYAYLVDKNGKVKKVERNYFKFSYDYSILQKTKEIVLEAIFTLKRQNPKLVEKRAVWALEYRKKTQPFGVASSGCFFKNLGNVSAGYLIYKAGLKGFTLGDYFISPVHANFIINKGKGKRQDLLKLVKIIKEKVKEKFGVELKEEVIVV